MTPLKIFGEVVKKLSQKPFAFWPLEMQNKLLKDCQSAVKKLMANLEKQSLQDTNAYKILKHLEQDVSDLAKNDLLFVQHLYNLVEVYRLAPLEDELAEFITQLESNIGQTKAKLLEHHVALENLAKKAKKMTTEQKAKSDLETIQKTGVFYVLEYTLQVLWEFGHLKDEDKKKLLETGLKTKAGNLPAYLPLEETFRKELCYKIFDDKLKDSLLVAFYTWEEVLYNKMDNKKALILALKQFNLALLQAFLGNGYTVFKAAIYAPYGNNLKIEELIENLK